MADRRFYQFTESLRRKLTFIEGNFVVGSSGAVGTVKGAGVKSITKTGTGLYRITLEDAYYRYLAGTFGFVDAASVGIPSIVHVTVIGNPNTTIKSKYIDIAMYNATVLADPSANLVFGFTMWLDNTGEVPANEK